MARAQALLRQVGLHEKTKVAALESEKNGQELGFECKLGDGHNENAAQKVERVEQATHVTQPI